MVTLQYHVTKTNEYTSLDYFEMGKNPWSGTPQNTGKGDELDTDIGTKTKKSVSTVYYDDEI